MDSILNTNFILDPVPQHNSFKDKINVVLIIVLLIIAVAVLSVNYIPSNFSVIKLLKNKCIKCILAGLLLIYAYFNWCNNKVSVITMTIILCCLFYVVNDDVENVENFTDFYYGKINDNNMESTLEFSLDSQQPYKTAGCTHIDPDGECNSDNEVNIIDGSPQINELELNGYTGQSIGADLNNDGNDSNIQNNMLSFGKTYNTKEPYLMVPLNGNSFLKENARKTWIQNRGKVDKIFDARDFSIQTNNGIKKSETYNQQHNLICDGTICRRPDIMNNMM